MKKAIASLLLVSTLSFCNFKYIFAAPAAPDPSAAGMVVLDATTGEVLFEKNKDVKYPPASPTKLMTALLTLENCNLDEKVTVGATPPTIEGSRIYIDQGEVLTVRQLLYSLIMVSANDCAQALAEHIGGTQENFAKMMNERAKELGCKNTNFTNPHGLYEPNHRTTAYDLALVEKELLKNPEYIKISKTKTLFLDPTNKYKEKRPLWNDNRLLHNYEDYYYEPCIAAKTGYTDESLHSFVASAEKGNEKYIVSLLYDPYKTYFKDSRDIFEWAFNNFDTIKLYSKNDLITSYEAEDGTIIPLLASNDEFYTKDLSAKEEPQISFNTDNLDKKSFLKGQLIATATMKYNNSTKEIKLISGTDYAPKKFPVVAKIIKDNERTIKIALIIGFILLLVLIVLIIRRINLRKKRRRRLNRLTRRH
ncbi:D-alanyl-D-alanine carboxypeptidase family protein [Clostridium sp. Marseille-QA1073]